MVLQEGITEEVGQVKTTNSPQSLKILRQSYRSGSKSKPVSRNFYIREEQDDMLAELAKYHGESKITILRAIIDDWREMKLREGGQ